MALVIIAAMEKTVQGLGADNVASETTYTFHVK
jgi:hypothetical protein